LSPIRTPTRDDRLRTLEAQIAQLAIAQSSLRQQADFWSGIRLAIFGGGLLLSFLAFFAAQASWAFFAVALPTLILFAGAVRVHRQLTTSVERFSLHLDLRRTQLARLKLDWAAIPAPRTDPPPDEHPFARDLDLTGSRSLHHLIDTAVTREGSQRLLAWLLQPAPDPARIASRQALLKELIPMRRFRDRLWLAAALAGRRGGLTWEARRLLGRLESGPAPDELRPTLLILAGLAAVNVILFVLYAAGVLPALWIVSLVIYAGLTLSRRELIEELFDEALELTDGLRRLSAILDFLEGYRYGARPGLTALLAPILQAETRPSRFLRQVERVASAASLQGNPFVWLPLNAIVPWDVFFAYRLSRHKAALRDLLPRWLDAWFELEALDSLADFAWLNPAYPFPQIAAPEARPVFEGRGLGHPLIDPVTRICNDFAFEAPGQIAIITGSNMSGKSSFLRTVGVNMQLAWAGSVVVADGLTLAPFRLFTCIRVTDSVTDGISYFYAEVQRLRALMDAIDGAHAAPLFFLIDEIFRGTNNRERLTGSRAYLRELVRRGATGLLATHDLELVHLADSAPAITNYHFREQVADGRMLFDYHLRPGPCPTTNALRIMALAGLPIEDGE
jgi:hypothetical protein